MAEEKKIRVQCDLPNASHCIGGIRFGTAREASEGAPAVLVSASVEESRVERLLKIPGYTLASNDWDAADLARVDASIAEAIQAEKAAKEQSSPAASRELEEQRRANRSMSDELAALR